jgi:glycosyltransferase involved in cell wall biosynthesis
MRIVIDARLYGVEHRGLGRYLVELINSLSNLDRQTDYVLLVDPRNSSQPTGLPKNFSLAMAPWRVYSWQEQCLLPWLLWKLKPDLVHFPHFTVPLLCPWPFVVTIHDLILHHFASERATTLPRPLYWLKVALYHWVVAWAVWRARLIITVSQTVGQEIKKFYKVAAAKISVIPLAPRTAAQPAKLDLPSNYILAVGAAYPHKNLSRLLKVFARLNQQLPSLNLIIVGKSDSFMLNLEAEAAKLNLAGVVKFWGQASEAELTSLYRQATVYVLPSLIEGFGLGPLEALKQGTAVLAADIPVLREILGQAAWYANPYDEDDIYQQLKTLVSDSNLRASRRANGQIVVEAYSWDKAGQQTLKSYLTTVH